MRLGQHAWTRARHEHAVPCASTRRRAPPSQRLSRCHRQPIILRAHGNHGEREAKRGAFRAGAYQRGIRNDARAKPVHHPRRAAPAPPVSHAAPRASLPSDVLDEPLLAHEEGPPARLPQMPPARAGDARGAGALAAGAARAGSAALCRGGRPPRAEKPARGVRRARRFFCAC